MTLRRWVCLLAWAAGAAAAAGASGAEADTARDVFQSLYGEDLERVAGTRDTADDAALAARLVDAAE